MATLPPDPFEPGGIVRFGERLRGVTSRRGWIGRALGTLDALELTWVCCGVDYPRVVEGGDAGADDPIAQTFIIKEKDNAPGMFITKLDLYFETKDSDLGMVVQLRTVEHGFPAAKILPYGTVHLKS